MKNPKENAPWNWKTATPADNARLRMLYEPGNWGDLFKGTWVVSVTTALAQTVPDRAMRYLDPFAGAPAYPLTPAAARRMHSLAQTPLGHLAQPFLRNGEWPSSALLVRAACAELRRSVAMSVFDLDASRRTAWPSIPEARLCGEATGEEALAAAVRADPPFDLALVDPYDFLADWKRLLPPALALSKRAGVLCYIYNRAPRSVGHLNLYKRFRKELELLRAGQPFLLGRLACDELFPRAYHELLLLGPPAILATLRETLREETQTLARRLAEGGAFEEGGGA